jgi:hypothetical protein
MLLPASFHSLQGFSMPRWNRIFILGKKTVFECVDDGRKEDHFFPPHWMSNPLIRVFIASQALFLVLVVKWVYREVVSTLTWPKIF